MGRIGGSTRVLASGAAGGMLASGPFSSPLNCRFSSLLRVCGTCVSLVLVCFSANAANGIEERVAEIIEQNRRLQEEVKAQQQVIDRLSAEVAAMRGASERHERELQELQERGVDEEPGRDGRSAARSEPAVRISGEAGLAFFDGGSAGQFPNAEFRVDEAKVAIEARVWRNAFAFAELNLITREVNHENFTLGEFYLDFENVFGGRLGNVRVGRIAIPFGEEYQVRSVMNNPLITHSLSDIWGIDEGVEVYGEAGGFDYVIAVQNGGHSILRDHDADKALTARIGYAPSRWLKLSASAMRTGDLSVKSDVLSEVWFGNGFFRAIGGAATTRTFGVELYELDATGRWSTGRVSAAAGWVSFDDDDTAANNAREMDYQFVEGVQGWGEKFYGAIRYSAIRVPGGYPLAGLGNAGTFFHHPAAPLTKRLERLSLGFGYRFGPPLVLKFEYSLERGRMVNGAGRDDEDMISSEIGLKF